ncbi:mechanosensitive ion channel protein 6-like [Chenopodium quinoa]|uniref:mechanosensitive ion channel protein 6-like n=1 Tax=Chenopodium quinoa TaxID=63459 RepID=UPI000B79A56D|nr:mechanosensitive ion channel protein 6-like [Chenopodium quinoa]
MDYSLRKSSFNSSSHGSSSSFKNRSNGSDDDESSPTLTIEHPHHIHDVGGNNTPSSQDEFIVKIDHQDDTLAINNKTSTSHGTLWRGSSEEFSFPKPIDDIIKDDEDGRTSTGSGGSIQSGHHDPTIGDMSLDMDMDVEELRQRHSNNNDQTKIRRQVLQGGKGLPPLHSDYSSWSRNPSESQSPDISSNLQYKSTPNNNPSNNDNGSKETRVSFHESLTSDLARRPSEMYSNVQDDSTSCNSSNSRDDDNNFDDTNNNHKNHNHSSEIRRSPSNKTNASYRRMSLSKTRSRLMDPPASPTERSGVIPKSGTVNMRSGFLGKTAPMYDDDDDDPFLDEDVPEEFKSVKFGTMVVIEWVSLIAITGGLICSLVIPILRKKTIWNMKLWKWLVLILVLICGRLVSNWGIRLIMFLTERNCLLRKRVLYFVFGLRKAVQNVIWLGLALIAWYILFDKRALLESRSAKLKIVTKLLIIAEVGAILWLLKTLLVKVLASNFHVKAFFDRIQDSLFNQFVIETLSAPPVYDDQGQDEEEIQNAGISMPFNVQGTAFARSKSGTSNTSTLQRAPNGARIHQGVNATTPVPTPIPTPTPSKSPIGYSSRLSEPNHNPNKKQDEGITIDHLHKLNQNNVSAWNMKRLIKIIRHGALTTLDEQIVGVTAQDDESTTRIRSEAEAKAAAKKIFCNVAKPFSRYIYLDDLMRFMREDEAERTLSLFEGGIDDERISKKSMKNWVVNAFRERRALSLTLGDTKSAVNKLHKMVNVIVSIIIVIFGFIFLNIISSQSLLFLSSQVVVVAFVFGNTCKNIFESIVFLFVIHPFDVGDRCEIDGVQMVVEEINILTTVFLRFDNQKIVFPNYILLTKPIHNYYRSPDMGDGIELCFHIATPAEKIVVIRQRITSYIENKKEHWYPKPMVILKDTDGLNMLRIAVWLQHRMNHQDMGERWVRRALLIEECVKIFREMDIEYRVYPMNVNVTSIPTLNYAQVSPPSWNAPPPDSGKQVVVP